MNKKTRRIILFTGDDIFYAPLLLENLLKNKKSDIHHVYISKSFLSFKRLSKKLFFFIRNYYPFCISAKDLLNFFKMHIKFKIKCFIKNEPKNINDYLKRLGINCSYIDEINNDIIYKKLRDQEPDLFFFALFDKIASEEFCSIPKLGTYNIHMGKLPNYKGGLSSFWVLRFQDKTAGSSIHKVIKKIDSGELIDEVKFDINTNSMHLLMLKTMKESSGMINRAINNILNEKTNVIDITNKKSNYYLYPTKEDFKEFYKKGYRLI